MRPDPAAPVTAPAAAVQHPAIAIKGLWWREITRFRRQRSCWSRALLQPLLFWVLLAAVQTARHSAL